MTRIAALVHEDAFEKSLRLILLLNLLDALYTTYWLGLGWASEANPVMASAFELGPVLFLVSKLMLVSMSVWLLWRNRDRMLARLSAIPLGMLYAFVAGQHLGFAALTGL